MKHTVRFVWLDPDDVQKRLVRNPHYNPSQRVSLNSWCWTEVTPATHKKRFFEALEKDVKKHGFRNPIVVYALPEGLCLAFGCSRLRVAQKLGVPIKAIVNDYTGEFAESIEVTPENLETFFMDVPKRFTFRDSGFDYHYSIERNRRETYDEGGIRWMQGLDERDEIITNEFSWINEVSE